MMNVDHSNKVSRASEHHYVLDEVASSNTFREAEDFQKKVAEEIAKMRGNELVRDMLQDFDDAHLQSQLVREPDDSQPLTVEPPVTLSKITSKLTAVERLWLARIVKAQGKEVVLARWQAYEVHINYVRYLR